MQNRASQGALEGEQARLLIAFTSQGLMVLREFWLRVGNILHRFSISLDTIDCGDTCLFLVLALLSDALAQCREDFQF